MPNLYRGKAIIQYGGDALLQRPRIAALVAQSIGSFSTAEVGMANVFAKVIKVDEEIALEIYLVLKDAARKGVFESVLQRRLDAKAYNVLSELRQSLQTGGMPSPMVSGPLQTTSPPIIYGSFPDPSQTSSSQGLGDAPISAQVYTEPEIEGYQKAVTELGENILNFALVT